MSGIIKYIWTWSDLNGDQTMRKTLCSAWLHAYFIFDFFLCNFCCIVFFFLLLLLLLLFVSCVTTIEFTFSQFLHDIQRLPKNNEKDEMHTQQQKREKILRVFIQLMPYNFSKVFHGSAYFPIRFHSFIGSLPLLIP